MSLSMPSMDNLRIQQPEDLAENRHVTSPLKVPRIFDLLRLIPIFHSSGVTDEFEERILCGEGRK